MISGSHWYLSTGVLLLAGWAVIAAGRAFARGWRKSREKRGGERTR